MTKDEIDVSGMRKAIYDLDVSLWRARAEAIRESNYHTQLGHAIDALERLKVEFGIATPQPDTSGTRSWFTIDELNAWALKQSENYNNSTWTSANWNDDFFEVINPHKKDEVVRVYHDYWKEKNT